jgi:hypothetical protein
MKTDNTKMVLETGCVGETGRYRRWKVIETAFRGSVS